VKLLRHEPELPRPALNTTVAGLTVDALFGEQHVIVELDGYRGHHTKAQTERDRGRDLRLRGQAYTVVRYTWRQLTREPELVLADLKALVGGRSPPNQ
jgi:very-short-patch-repair endonuclease